MDVTGRIRGQAKGKDCGICRTAGGVVAADTVDDAHIDVLDEDVDSYRLTVRI